MKAKKTYNKGGKVDPPQKKNNSHSRNRLLLSEIPGLRANSKYYASLSPEYKKVYMNHLDNLLNSRNVSVLSASNSAKHKVQEVQREAREGEQNIKNFISDRKK